MPLPFFNELQLCLDLKIEGGYVLFYHRAVYKKVVIDCSKGQQRSILEFKPVVIMGQIETIKYPVCDSL